MAICQANEARGNTTEPKYPQRTHKRIVAVKQGGKKVHREKCYGLIVLTASFVLN